MFLVQIKAPPLAQIKTFIAQNIANGAAQFVAAAGDAVVGWCAITPRQGYAFRHIGTVGIGVLAAYRGVGLGRRLMASCLPTARANGLTRLELVARADNERAVMLYTSAGFQREALLRNAFCFDGRYYDAIQMSLIFEEEGLALTAASAPVAASDAISSARI